MSLPRPASGRRGPFRLPQGDADAPQTGGPARLFRLREDQPHTNAARDPPNRRDLIGFRLAAGVADAAARSRSRHAIDDDLIDRHADLGECTTRIRRFGNRERLRERDPVKPGPRAIPQQLARVRRLLLERRDQPIGGLRPVDARQLFSDDPVIALERVEHADQ